MVRVCNLCLEKLAEVEEDDDDDRRSIIISSVTSFPAHQLGIDAFITHPQSPFAASQLFGPTNEPFNLYSIAETKKRPHIGSDDDTRPEAFYLAEGADGIWGNPAPFRRPLPDEEKDHGDVVSFNLDIPLNSKGHVEFPTTTKPITIDTSMSSIQFPIGSPEHSPRPLSKSRGGTYGEYEVATPFIRSRVQSRLDTSFDTEPDWRIRRESTA
jgi:1-phosphatidylinositol-3-phosphate 5-kinase